MQRCHLVFGVIEFRNLQGRSVALRSGQEEESLLFSDVVQRVWPNRMDFFFRPFSAAGQNNCQQQTVGQLSASPRRRVVDVVVVVGCYSAAQFCDNINDVNTVWLRANSALQEEQLVVCSHMGALVDERERVALG